MKLTKTLFCLTVVALALTTSKVSAFPLYLTALSGSISSTANYGSTALATSNKAVTVAVTLAKMINVVSNQVFLDTGFHAPADAKIAFDPYTAELYLTNSGGYSRSLNTSGHDEGQVRIREIATTFATNGLSETDKIIIELDLYGTGSDGLFYEFDVRGTATLKITVSSTTGIASMSLKMASTSGSGYGEYRSSDDGVSTGGFTFAGSGTPEWVTPYSVFWWNN